MCKSAVLLIIFNRPSTTERVFDVIRKVQPKRLYIAADAPRADKPEDKEKCEKAREVTEDVDWPCQVNRLYQEVNLGCSKGPISAFDWFFSFEEEGIILEDDCLASTSFFSFCDEMLKHYRNDEKIILVSGCNLGFNLQTGYSYGFSGVPNMWGWATWKRSAELVDYELTEWKNVKNKLFHVYKAFRQSLFDTDLNWYRYWIDKFDRTIQQSVITWWDWQWIYYQARHNKLSIFPAVNLVRNIGFNEDATHTKEEDNPAANLYSFDLLIPFKHPLVIKRDLNYEENCLKWKLFYHKRLPWHFHIRHSFKMWVIRKLKPNSNQE